MDVTEYINHVRNHSYMSGIERDALRIKHTAEVFTPFLLVNDMLNHIPKEMFVYPLKTFIDNSCGDGQFLVEVVIRKLQNGIPLNQALSTVYGVDLMLDNVKLCQQRLSGPNPTTEILEIVNKNIVCKNSLRYNYSFGKKVGIEKWI